MILARFKAATGLPDRELATLLGVARSTTQAILAGKLPHTLTDAARRAVLTIVTERQRALAQLAEDLTT